ncbi:hypothetical protein L210DRAFT_3650325 [Boletus edulis BED1]|uniref:Uncharacterized protein n=1 Tax=Boletus edulis BED1 TaxID=1328754 RepID=A0AAD4BJ27_BOLED|nr:hypothetical protein L210DRAFT_3650325 [Boletus edulis BED1]
MSDILAIARPVSSDDPKAILMRNFKSANKIVFDVVKTVLDDKDTLQESRRCGILPWCNQLHICLRKACEHGVETLVENRTVLAMQEVEGFANKWKEAKARREEAGRRGASTQETNSTGFKTTRLLEEPATNNATNITSESGSRPTASDPAPKVFPWSKMSVKRKRTTPEVTIDEDADDDEIEVVEAPTPANPSRIVHNPHCEPCEKQDRQCVGVPNRRRLVNPARKVKASSSNAGPSAVPLFLKDTSPLLEDEDDKMPTKKAKSAGPSGPTPEMLADAKRAILAVEAKLHSDWAFLKDLEVRVNSMDAVVAVQQVEELARVKSEML